MNNFRFPRFIVMAAIVAAPCLIGLASAAADKALIQVQYDDASQMAVFFPTDQTKPVIDASPVVVEDGSGNKAILIYEKANNLIKFKNECDSKEAVMINFFGNEIAAEPCEEKKLYIAQHKPSELVEPGKNEVIVDINMDGTLVAYTSGGKAFTVNSGLTEVDMGDGKFVHFNYLDMKDLLIIKNACDSKEDILVKVFDSEFVLKPCAEEKVLLSSAEGPAGFPQNEFAPESIENVEEGREPISPFAA